MMFCPTKRARLLAAGLALLLSGFGSVAALAQDTQSATDPAGAPTRNANEWNGQDHQPTQGSVNGKLEQSGMAPETGANRDRDLARIKQQLDKKVEDDTKNAEKGSGSGQ